MHHSPVKKVVTSAAFKDLLEGAEVLRYGRGDAVKVAINKKTNNVIKIFGLADKNFFRKHMFSPGYYFIENARKLAQYNVVTIKPEAWYFCPEEKREIVIYPSIEGVTVYDAVHKNGDVSFVKAFAKQIALIHKKNIYFRAGHGDNYLVQADGGFALIDVDNLRFSISLRQRAKNLSYIWDHTIRNYPDFFSNCTFQNFLQIYFSNSGLKSWEIRLVQWYLMRYMQKWAVRRKSVVEKRHNLQYFSVEKS